MGIKHVLKKSMVIFFVLIIFIFNTSVGAAEEVARLKSCLENDHMYENYTVFILGSWIGASTTSFKNNFEGKYVTVSGRIGIYSVSSNRKKITLYSDNPDGDGEYKSIDVDTSDSSLAGTVSSIKPGDTVRVYGKISSLQIKAEHIVINPEFDFKTNSHVFYPDKVFDEETVTDLAGDGHVSFRLPAAWKSDFVMGRLTNNDVNGYSFFLNAISPQNLKYPENFYIFYFNFETYLDHPPKSPTKGDRMDIEGLIINNILENLSGSFNPKMTEITVFDGTKLDYCQTVYKPKDGNDYRLEFLFKPDNGGIICMLYLYYPNDTAVNHIREAAYLVQTIKN